MARTWLTTDSLPNFYPHLGYQPEKAKCQPLTNHVIEPTSSSPRPTACNWGTPDASLFALVNLSQSLSICSGSGWPCCSKLRINHCWLFSFGWCSFVSITSRDLSGTFERCPMARVGDWEGTGMELRALHESMYSSVRRRSSRHQRKPCSPLASWDHWVAEVHMAWQTWTSLRNSPQWIRQKELWILIFCLRPGVISVRV